MGPPLLCNEFLTLFGDNEKPVVKPQRGLNPYCFHSLLLKEGMQYLLQVAAPERIGISVPYQRYPGERRFEPECKIVPFLQDRYYPWT